MINSHNKCQRGVGMPRKNKKARNNKRTRRLNSEVALVKFDRKEAETMSPGRLVAAADWRGKSV